MTISKPTLGSTGWNTATDAVIDAVNGLGGAAALSVGTTTGTVAAGNDTRITGAAQKAANLSDLASAATARTNLAVPADSAVVHNTGAETIAGVKTFSSAPIAPGLSAQLYAFYNPTGIAEFTVVAVDLTTGGVAYNQGLDVTTNTGFITIPTGKGGIYLASTIMHFKTGNAGARDAMLIVNSSIRAQAGGYGQGDCRFPPTFVTSLAAGDVVGLSLYVIGSSVQIESFTAADISLALTKIG